MRLMSISLPGMGLAERTTVSPGRCCTWRWSWLAMRTRAEVGSPWAPVVTMTARSGRVPPQLLDGDEDAVGALEVALLQGHLRRCPIMLRPVMNTRRSLRWAASMTCWTREMREAKVATMTRPGRRGHDVVQRLADHLLRGRVAGHLGVGGVGQEEEDAFAAELGQTGQVGGFAHDGRVVQLEVAGVHNGAHRCADGQAAGVGDAVGDAHELHLEGCPGVTLLAGAHRAQVASSRSLCSLQLDRDEAVGQAWCSRWARAARAGCRAGRRCGLRGRG